ncbi:unnamed protein product (macronuclear) [Paramecium tetraurelia]|uniref:Protein kinase domain-containing protein n=1 Tax=Paramecium tetraurelia TaxID=5888 RepID=A0DD50_PARTE|nr:uncharacterized protein GSPATT00015826001 [Paramecium tetraurelia]CAK80967.1 unnamed protein product [Paramecium tetraurelia]|eukprot:XP_001448364.1 hypothetical protein (macronuclear) [Paramecium tetraurelia strain d4-2]
MSNNTQTSYGFHNIKYWSNKHYEFCSKIKDRIFIAEDIKHNNRKIVIKQITNQSKKYREREKQITKDLINLYKINHYNPHIIEYYDLFDENDSTFIVMQNCESNLSTLYQKTVTSFQVKNYQFYCNVLDIIRQIIEGYQFLYYQFGSNFQHRDLKPENILFVDNQYKICDFEFYKISYENPTKEIGTQNFQAPELYGDNNYDNKCDIYSLGIILLWLLTGQYSKDKISGLNSNFQELLKIMLEDNPKTRISWNQLFKHPVYVKEPKDFLNTEKVNNTSLTLYDLSQIIQLADLDSTQSSFTQKTNTSFIQQNNCLQELELNKLISDTFKNVNENNMELSRILFALWVKIYDKKILQENDEIRRKEYHRLKQLIRINNQVDYRIEFLTIQELCQQLFYHLEHFKSDEDLIKRLKAFLEKEMNLR